MRHADCVDAWMERAAVDLSAARLALLFARALEAIWHRAEVPLGEITLTAIARRVMAEGRKKHPVLVALQLEPAVESFRAIPARADALDEAAMRGAMRGVLTDLLTIVGSLTAEVLTPTLHAELEAVTLEQDAKAEP